MPWQQEAERKDDAEDAHLVDEGNLKAANEIIGVGLSDVFGDCVSNLCLSRTLLGG